MQAMKNYSAGLWDGEVIEKTLDAVKAGDINDAMVEQIAAVAANHKGKLLFAGFTTPEYALASLKWINTAYSLKLFGELAAALPEQETIRINTLISEESFKKI